jgi:outer membrane immunogenic protein
MRIVKTLAGALALAVIGSQASFGADIARPVYKAAPGAAPSFTWSGFYGGIHVGYGWAGGDVAIGIVDAAGIAQGAAAAGVFPVSYSISRDGVVGGLQFGFNRQIGPWVWGLEADFSGTDLSGTQTVLRPAIGLFPNLSEASQDMDWFGTVRLRGGYAAGDWLFYGTGGLAYGHVKYSYSQTNVPFGGAVNIRTSDSKVEVGWTAGAGIERAWGPWTARVEYLYFDLGSRELSAQHNLAPAVFFLPKFDNTGSIVRVGLNRKLDWLALR